MREPRRFRHKTIRANLVCKRRIFPLQKSNDGVNRPNVLVLQGHDALCIGGHSRRGRANVLEQTRQTFLRKQRQDDLDAKISLPCRNLPGVQKTLQVRRSGVRRVQLREGRRDQKNGGLQGVADFGRESTRVWGVWLKNVCYELMQEHVSVVFAGVKSLAVTRILHVNYITYF